MEEQHAIGPELYDRSYYLRSLPGLEHLEDPEVIDTAAEETIRFGSIKAGDRVLDFGCGRGSLAIVLAKEGSSVLGVDFSRDAIDFAQEYRKRFAEEIQKRTEFRLMTMDELNWEGEFDVIVLNQVYEHLHDWELEILLSKLKRALKATGTLVISTPNLNYIRFLYPLKRLSEFPFKAIKEILRFFRGRSKHASSLKAFLREIFKIRYPESEHTRLHINLQTPGSIRKFMERRGFSVTVECIDRRHNLLSRATCKWWGETIWLAAIVMEG